MNPPKKRSKGVNVGTSLILVTFVLLCLVAFAALSLSTAQSDYQLSHQTLQRKQAYFTACNLAEARLQTLDELFSSCLQEAGREQDYYQKIIQAVSSDTSMEVLRTEPDAAPVISYSVPINDRETLLVRLRICYPETDAPERYQIISYRTETTAEPTEENTIQKNGGLIF